MGKWAINTSSVHTCSSSVEGTLQPVGGQCWGVLIANRPPFTRYGGTRSVGRLFWPPQINGQVNCHTEAGSRQAAAHCRAPQHSGLGWQLQNVLCYLLPARRGYTSRPLEPPFGPWVHIKALGSSLGAVGTDQGPWILPWGRGYTSRPPFLPGAGASLGPWSKKADQTYLLPLVWSQNFR